MLSLQLSNIRHSDNKIAVNEVRTNYFRMPLVKHAVDKLYSIL